jgi:hypothetical protein
MVWTRQFFIVFALLLGLTRPGYADESPDAAKIDEQARAYFRVEAYEDAARESIRAFDLEPKATRL